MAELIAIWRPSDDGETLEPLKAWPHPPGSKLPAYVDHEGVAHMVVYTDKRQVGPNVIHQLTVISPSD